MIEKIQKYLPIILFVAIWLSAFILWLKQPLPINNYFAPRVLPPNFETYPFSDAERYSLDSIRIINGLTSNFIISKPFHAIYLAILNYIGTLELSECDPGANTNSGILPFSSLPDRKRNSRKYPWIGFGYLCDL